MSVMRPISTAPPYSAEQIDKLQLLRMIEDYSIERVELWLRAIKADLTAAQGPPSLAPGTPGDPRR